MPSPSQVAQARRKAESLMTDSCTIGVESQSPNLDESTGTYPTVIAAPVYSGICQFILGSTESRTADAGGQIITEQGNVLKLPVEGSEAVQVNMVVRLTASQFDAGLIGLKGRIIGPSHSGFAPSRRFSVEQVV